VRYHVGVNEACFLSNLNRYRYVTTLEGVVRSREGNVREACRRHD
jgi:hypothetical protein